MTCQPALNPLERILFWSAIGTAGVVVAIRVAAALYLFFSR